MRLILQGRPSSKPIIPDLWVLLTEDGFFKTPQYLVKGYNRMDAYLVGGGGGGGAGGASSFTDANTFYSGGGGGGGGGGELSRIIGIDLLQVPLSSEHKVGPGGQQSTNDGFDGQYTYFLNYAYAASGGSPGANGYDAPNGRHAGGSGGGNGSIDAAVRRTMWDANSPNIPATGSIAYPGFGGNGGNGSTQDIPPTSGTDGIDRMYRMSGGGGGGGGIGVAGTVPSNVDTRSRGGGGGAGWNTKTTPFGAEGILTYSSEGSYYFKAAGGGAPGAGHNLSKVNIRTGLLGQPGTDYIAKGTPGAGGSGGVGGYSNIKKISGQPGRAGSDGCILIRLYAV